MTYIFDFDGTLTDPFPHADAMREMMIDILVSEGIPEDKVREDIDMIRNRIFSQPQKHPWIINDITGCYGNEDPFVVNNVIAQELPGISKIYSEVIRNPGELSSISYRDATRDMLPHLRSDTIVTFERILRNGNKVYIVTNGGTDKVKRMISEMDINVPVYGEARKFEVNKKWEKLPEKMEIDGLPIFLRREKYYNILQGIEGDKTVVGDVFSMDLSLPYVLGIPIAIVKTVYTPSWAERFVCKNGRVLERILDVIVE